MKTDLTYNEAYSQLEELVIQLEDDSIQLDTLASKVKQAHELIELCERKLRAIHTDVDNALPQPKGKPN